MSLNTKVLLIPIGLAYWRTSLGQASQRASYNYRSLIQMFEIDNHFLNDPNLPLLPEERKIAVERLMRRTAIQIFSNTIAKGNLLTSSVLEKD